MYRDKLMLTSIRKPWLEVQTNISPSTEPIVYIRLRVPTEARIQQGVLDLQVLDQENLGLKAPMIGF